MQRCLFVFSAIDFLTYLAASFLRWKNVYRKRERERERMKERERKRKEERKKEREEEKKRKREREKKRKEREKKKKNKKIEKSESVIDIFIIQSSLSSFFLSTSFFRLKPLTFVRISRKKKEETKLFSDGLWQHHQLAAKKEKKLKLRIKWQKKTFCKKKMRKRSRRN